ncbi:response regulator [bacterium]|nr:response regulator [bacterium]
MKYQTIPVPLPNPVTILLVEDDPDHSTAIIRSMKRFDLDYKFHHVITLAEAREYLRNNTPDIVLTDYMLPDGDGLDLLPAEDSEPECAYIVLTSQGNEMVAVEAMKRGVMDYVVKTPPVMREMHQIVRRCLREWITIQEKKIAELEIKRSMERFQNLFEQSSEAIFVRRQGNFLLVNENFCNMFIVERDAVYKGDFDLMKYVHEEDIEKVADRLKNPTPGKPCRFRITLEGGLEKHLRSSTSVINWEGDEAIIGSIEDISAEVELNTQREKEQQFEAVKKLILTIAHEFRQPMAILQGSADLISSGIMDPEKIIEMMPRVTRQVQRMDKLVDRLVKLRELKEVDYAQGLKYFDVLGETPPDNPSS